VSQQRFWCEEDHCAEVLSDVEHGRAGVFRGGTPYLAGTSKPLCGTPRYGKVDR
jgi:hypothetical protein